MELNLHIPTALHELTPKQLKFVSRLFLNQRMETDFLLKAFLFFTELKLLTERKPDEDGARWFLHPSQRNPFIIDNEILAIMCNKCRFLLTPGEVKPIKWIRFARARHFRLYNVTFGEYLMAENFYFAYIETKEERHLDNLMAVLYRAPWQRYNEGKIQSRAQRFSTVPAEVKNSVFMWYVGFRAFVPKRCPSLFSRKKSSRPFTVRGYINGMIHQLSDGDITRRGTLEKQPLWHALDEMEQRAIDVEQEEMKMRKK